MAKQEKLKSVSELQTLDAPNLLDEMITTFRPKDDSTRKHAESLVKNLVEQLLDPTMVVRPGFTRTVNERIAARLGRPDVEHRLRRLYAEGPGRFEGNPFRVICACLSHPSTARISPCSIVTVYPGPRRA